MENIKSDKWKAFFTALAGAGAIGGAYLVYKNISNKEENGENNSASYPPKLLPASNGRRSVLVKSTAKVPSASSLNFDPAELAQQLYRFGTLLNIEGVISCLQQIRSIAEYSNVNEAYKLVTDRNTLVKQTIVTGLQDRVFARNKQAKDRIKTEFLRIGLKLDSINEKWSLQGFTIHRDLITLKATIVTDWMGNKIKVAKGTILGDEKYNSNGSTSFVGIDGKMYKVRAGDVKYLSAQY